jgi:1,4-alpha-glucan branching enzyme
MIYKSPSPLAGHVRITFELPSCLWADRIFLVGDFNHWDSQATPMQQDRDGVWRAVIDLKRGEQAQFRYLIDGQWRTDYHADGSAQNNFGSENSIVCADLPEEVEIAATNDSVQESFHPQPATTLRPMTDSRTRRLRPLQRSWQPKQVAA